MKTYRLSPYYISMAKQGNLTRSWLRKAAIAVTKSGDCSEKFIENSIPLIWKTMKVPDALKSVEDNVFFGCSSLDPDTIQKFKTFSAL